MARVLIRNPDLIVRLSLVEQVMAVRRSVRVPLESIEAVSVLSHPVSSFPGPMRDVTMGFGANSAPFAHVATVGPRAKYRGGQALVVVWGDRPSVMVELNSTAGGWRLLVVSVPEPEVVAQQVRAELR